MVLKTSKPNEGVGYEDPNEERTQRPPGIGKHWGSKPSIAKLKRKSRRRDKLARLARRRNRK